MADVEPDPVGFFPTAVKVQGGKPVISENLLQPLKSEPVDKVQGENPVIPENPLQPLKSEPVDKVKGQQPAKAVQKATFNKYDVIKCDSEQLKKAKNVSETQIPSTKLVETDKQIQDGTQLETVQTTKEFAPRASVLEPKYENDCIQAEQPVERVPPAVTGMFNVEKIEDDLVDIVPTLTPVLSQKSNTLGKDEQVEMIEDELEGIPHVKPVSVQECIQKEAMEEMEDDLIGAIDVLPGPNPVSGQQVESAALQTNQVTQVVHQKEILGTSIDADVLDLVGVIIDRVVLSSMPNSADICEENDKAGMKPHNDSEVDAKPSQARPEGVERPIFIKPAELFEGTSEDATLVLGGMPSEDEYSDFEDEGGSTLATASPRTCLSPRNNDEDEEDVGIAVAKSSIFDSDAPISLESTLKPKNEAKDPKKVKTDKVIGKTSKKEKNGKAGENGGSNHDQERPDAVERPIMVFSDNIFPSRAKFGSEFVFGGVPDDEDSDNDFDTGSCMPIRRKTKDRNTNLDSAQFKAKQTSKKSSPRAKQNVLKTDIYGVSPRSKHPVIKKVQLKSTSNDKDMKETKKKKKRKSPRQLDTTIDIPKTLKGAQKPKKLSPRNHPVVTRKKQNNNAKEKLQPVRPEAVERPIFAETASVFPQKPSSTDSNLVVFGGLPGSSDASSVVLSSAESTLVATPVLPKSGKVKPVEKRSPKYRNGAAPKKERGSPRTRLPQIGAPKTKVATIKSKMGSSLMPPRMHKYQTHHYQMDRIIKREKKLGSVKISKQNKKR